MSKSGALEMFSKRNASESSLLKHASECGRKDAMHRGVILGYAVLLLCRANLVPWYEGAET